LLCFDSTFDSQPHYQLIKQMFIQVFGSPSGHPKVKPFIDHLLSFFIADHRIWFRNYQIIYEPEASSSNKDKDPVLVEIGPRFVLNPIRIFEGSFGGIALWENGSYVGPNVMRQKLNALKSTKYQQRVASKQGTLLHRQLAEEMMPDDQLEHVFDQGATTDTNTFVHPNPQQFQQILDQANKYKLHNKKSQGSEGSEGSQGSSKQGEGRERRQRRKRRKRRKRPRCW